MIEIGALWVNTTPDGRSYMSGKLGQARLLMFANDRKTEGSKQPDYRLYVAPALKRDEVKDDTPDGERVPF